MLLISFLLLTKELMEKMIITILLMVRCLFAQNYIQNSGFENPSVSSYAIINFTNDFAPWLGFFEVRGGSYTIGFGQYIELEDTVNGNITQNVTLPYDGTYNLSFYRKAYNSNYSSYRLQVIWNNVSVLTVQPAETTLQREEVIVNGSTGLNNIMFKQIGLASASISVGLMFDEISLELISITNTTSPSTQNTTNSTNTTFNETNSTFNETNSAIIVPNQPNNNSSAEKNPSLFGVDGDIWAIIFQLPITKVPVSRYIFFVLDDIWLYSYDQHEYRGLMKNILDFVLFLENLKWDLLDRIYSLYFLKDYIPISDYSEFSNKKVMEIEGTDINTFKILFPFFIYSIPLTALFCIIFFILFKLLFRYPISAYFRRYYFYGGSILQILFENNVGYFIFISLCQLEILFSFGIVDKLFMVFAVLFMLGVTLIATSFYLIVGYLYQKKACYFIYCFYRLTPTYVYLTIKLLMRGIFKGWVHYLLVNHYSEQMLCLAFIEISVTFLTVYMQRKYDICISKTFFSLFTLYHAIFAILDIFFAFESKLLQFGVEGQIQHESIQSILIYSILALVFLMMILDFLPVKFANKEEMKELQEGNQSTKNQTKQEEATQNKKQFAFLENISDPHPEIVKQPKPPKQTFKIKQEKGKTQRQKSIYKPNILNQIDANDIDTSEYMKITIQIRKKKKMAQRDR